MQRHLESKTEDVLSMLNEDDLYQDGDREGSVVVLEEGATQNRHQPNPRLVLDQAVSVEASEVASKVVVEEDSAAGSEAIEVIEVGMAEEEASATTEVIEAVEAVEADTAVVRLQMPLVVREEEVDMEVTKIDATVTEVVGMVVDATEEVQAATETP